MFKLDKGPGKYAYCSNCHNTAKGVKILRCHGCNRLYCEACVGDKPNFHNPYQCPHCGIGLATPLGDSRYTCLGEIG